MKATIVILEILAVIYLALYSGLMWYARELRKDLKLIRIKDEDARYLPNEQAIKRIRVFE